MSGVAGVVEDAEVKMRGEWRVMRRGGKEEKRKERGKADHGSNSPNTLNMDLQLLKLYWRRVWYIKY
jgi:hypothetical protein